MDKAQAIHTFWSSFGLTAYDEMTVPDDAQMPYITYDMASGKLEDSLAMYGNLWYYDTSWEAITKKAEQIAEAIAGSGYYSAKIDTGYVWITQGVPFAQRMSDPESDMVRRIYLNVNVEFLTPY